MTDTELIQALRPMVVLDKFRCLGCGHEHQCSTHGCAILKQAVERLEELTALYANEPVTEEDLCTMDGEPVFAGFGGTEGEWALVRAVEGDEVLLVHENGLYAPARFVFECGGQVYRRKPEKAEEQIPPNPQLTLEELREIAKEKPIVVWIVHRDDGGQDYGEWAMFLSAEDMFLGNGFEGGTKNYGTAFVAYRRKPEEADV